MAKYICLKTVEAVQWNAPGDHPAVIFDAEYHAYIIRAKHAFWNTTKVNPGDYIVTQASGKRVVVKKKKFEAMYRKVE